MIDLSKFLKIYFRNRTDSKFWPSFCSKNVLKVSVTVIHLQMIRTVPFTLQISVMTKKEFFFKNIFLGVKSIISFVMFYITFTAHFTDSTVLIQVMLLFMYVVYDWLQLLWYYVYTCAITAFSKHHQESPNLKTR